ncbi:polymeric immunoglobulin receptor-like [Alosa sapidissima]|uniref:polymeric immunoglobulin receptor-like n=1 Tax=Alosa sapidissima TaxID=34773 RepID=UPI001C09B52E|nr:polymeric immunoglobulin receptor-like [Alosa sapidissima]
MEILAVVLLFVLSAGAESFRVTGHEGGAVIINCTYKLLHQSNRKYLCKGSVSGCPNNIKADSKTIPAQNGRFSLYDNPSEGNFMVLITQLTTEDSGDYRCVVENAPRDTTTHIHLDVQKGNWNHESRTHYNGGSIEINCTFPKPYKHRSKYLCQGHGKLSCFELTSHETHKMKIQMIPAGENEMFSVTLLQLTERDAGEYWCGAGAAVESDRSITLIKKTQLIIETQLSRYVDGGVQIMCPYHPEDSEKVKLLCKDECKNHNILVWNQWNFCVHI